MSQGLRFVNLLALVALLAGLVGCGTAVDQPALGAGDLSSSANTARSPAAASATMESSQTAMASSQTSPSLAEAHSTRPTPPPTWLVAIPQTFRGTQQITGSLRKIFCKSPFSRCRT